MTTPPDLHVAVDDTTDEQEPPTFTVLVSYQEPTGIAYTAHVALPADATPPDLAHAATIALRAASNAISPDVEAVINEYLQPRPDKISDDREIGGPHLTVAKLDKMAAYQNAEGFPPPRNVHIPGLPNPVPFDVVRAILVCAEGQ